MSAALDRWLTRLYRAVGGSLFLALCAIVSYSAGDWRWPDPVRSSELLTAEVAPGGALCRARVIADLAECTLHDRRPLPGVGPDAGRVALPGTAFDGPPWDGDGLPETIETETSADFSCGPAMPAESPSAACIGLRRTVRPPRRPDAVTPFRGICRGGTTGPAEATTARAP